MKITTLLLSITLCSCTVYHGDKNKGTYTGVALGTDLKGYAQTSEGVKVDEANQVEAFKHAATAAGTAFAAKIAGDVARALSSDATKVSLGDQGVTKHSITQKEATKQLRVTEATKVKALEVAPTPVP